MKQTSQDFTYFKDSSITISRRSYKKAESDMLPHDHEYLTVSLLLAGNLIEHTNTGTRAVKPGSILIKPAALIHGDEFTKNCTLLSLKIHDWDYYNFDFNSWAIIQQNMLLKYFLKVVQSKNKKESLDELKANITAITNKCQIQKSVPDKIKHIRKLIDTHFLEALQISQLAKEINMHPVHLGRTFKENYNIDIKAYQQQLRTHFAVSEMITNSNNLTDISYSTGYADQSHFSRACKKSTDLSPKKITTLLNV
jgi:AraC family transcriptional regulator